MENIVKNNEQLINKINRIVEVLIENFKKDKKNRLKNDDLFTIIQELPPLLEEYSLLNAKECSYLCIKKIIPLLNLMCKIDKN